MKDKPAQEPVVRFLVYEHNVEWGFEIDIVPGKSSVIARIGKMELYNLAHQMLEEVIADDWLSGAPVLKENTETTP